ncbi:hypothetical protein [Pseudomonas sp. NCCP-436]|uniref:hypothetical protein n=1 Tax=Pseudomonas sp. NCCP-436 TaxID=2842481 RepID=UPI001C80F179|nr:hypothetical protein [Pseudomonas sp. NCCP-436]GIZ11683.1 hypothetical protein NCCP436_10990 [Pseudomonas sp. NCCP-436]
MVRIRGRIGDWPVDLTVELEPEDWACLAAHLSVEPVISTAATEAQSAAGDALWQAALKLVREAGAVEGPQLLVQLAGLAGSEAAGKRLLVRLRHCPQIRMETSTDAPVYHWVG